MYLEDGLSTVQIGKIVGLTPGAVGSILTRRGVKLRTPKEGFRKRFPNGRYGSLSARWSGGRRKANQSGYIYIYSPSHPNATKAGYVMEHILVAEKKIGRFLLDGEVVHHINHNKEDNRPENLMVLTRSEHIKLHFDLGNEVVRLREKIKKYEDTFGPIE